MKRSAIAGFALILCCTAATALAQTDFVTGTQAGLTSVCFGNQVVITAIFDVTELPGENIVGWRVEREVMGECDAEAFVNGLQPWPAIGQTSLTILVTPAYPNRDEIYYVWAIDDQGAKVFIPWGQRQMFTHAECLPGPSTVGTIVTLGGYAVFEPCPLDCWWGLSFWDTTIDGELAELADTGVLVNLYGSLRAGMEGPYIAYEDMTWSLSSEECTTVAVPEQTWDAVKAFYR